MRLFCSQYCTFNDSPFRPCTLLILVTVLLNYLITVTCLFSNTRYVSAVSNASFMLVTVFI